MLNPLHVLGIARGASIDDVKTAFRALSLKYHPDKNPDDKTAPEMFQQVLDAYDYVIQNPESLKIPTVAGYALPSYGEPITVTLESVYLHEKQTVTIERITHCQYCGGTGTETGKAGSCSTCDGTGKIKSSMARLMNIDPVCPYCHGKGYIGPSCTRCGGSKYVKQRHTAEFFVEPKNCYDGIIVLKGVGDITQSGVHKDLILPVRYEQKGSLYIEPNGTLSATEFVSPVEQVLTIVKTLKIFGREIRYRVPINGDDLTVRDMVGKIEREIQIHFITTTPKLTDTTKKLYKQILSLEKSDGF